MAKFSNEQEFHENSEEGSDANARNTDNVEHYNGGFL